MQVFGNDCETDKFLLGNLIRQSQISEECSKDVNLMSRQTESGWYVGAAAFYDTRDKGSVSIFTNWNDFIMQNYFMKYLQQA
jgi:hypothetical protein